MYGTCLSFHSGSTHKKFYETATPEQLKNLRAVFNVRKYDKLPVRLSVECDHLNSM